MNVTAGARPAAVCAFVAACLLALPGVVWAQRWVKPVEPTRQADRVAGIVVFDHRGAASGDLTIDPLQGAHVFVFPSEVADRRSFVCGGGLDKVAGVGALADLLRCANGGSLTGVPPASVNLVDRIAAAHVAADLITHGRNNRDLRVVSNRSSRVVVAVLTSAVVTSVDGVPRFVTAGVPKIAAREKSRRSRLDTDLDSLGRLVLGLAAGTATKALVSPTDEVIPWFTLYELPLSLERATVAIQSQITANPRERRTEAVAESGLGRTKEFVGEDEAGALSVAEAGGVAGTITAVQPPSTLTATISTGPREHWTLSADVPFSAETRWVVDGSGATLREKPPGFYLGLNFLLGDLAVSRRPWWGHITLKLMVAASTRPHESIGVGLGMRGSALKRFGLDFEVLSPFIAWTSDEIGDTGKRRWSALHLGVGLNLDRAFSWVQ